MYRAYRVRRLPLAIFTNVDELCRFPRLAPALVLINADLLKMLLASSRALAALRNDAFRWDIAQCKAIRLKCTLYRERPINAVRKELAAASENPELCPIQASSQ